MKITNEQIEKALTRFPLHTHEDDLEVIKKVLETVKMDAWQRLSEINPLLKEGECVIELMKFDKKLSEIYTAWWMDGLKYYQMDETEYSASCWVLNDDASTMDEDDEDMSKWFWRFHTPPKESEQKNENTRRKNT
tara:strand:+ start:6169 stop:6573 length:405 start_codon:yes stop_codon:yes gene_type:complete